MLEMLRLFFLITPIVIFVITIIQIIKKDSLDDVTWYIEKVMNILDLIYYNPILFYECLLSLEEDFIKKC